MVLLRLARVIPFNYNNYNLGGDPTTSRGSIDIDATGEGSGSAAVGSAAGRRCARGQRFIHDAPDRARASPALGATAETVVDLAGGPRRRFAVRQSRADIVIGEHVAGTDNHRAARRRNGTICNYPYSHENAAVKNNFSL